MTISIDPVIGKLGSLEFRWYGVIMALAVIVGTWVFSRELTRRGISSSHALGIAVLAVPCGVIGARVVHLFDHLGYYWENPGEIVGLQLVGLAIYGVVLGGLIGLIIYCRWKKLPVLRVVPVRSRCYSSDWQVLLSPDESSTKIGWSVLPR
jgi:phosphatidylglycerol:prolipoprotein diacylglycerol transferase